MGKLNQIVAIEKGIKSRSHAEISELYKIVQKPDLFGGLARNYQKKDEEGEDLPSEKKHVQFRGADVLARVQAALSELFDITARKDYMNCAAKADVTVDGRVILPQVPVTYLLFLEKQLTDVRSFIAAFPTLDESEAWALDANDGLYKTEPTRTHRTKKISRPIVLYPATVEHPAQTQLVQEDVLAGFWVQVKHSGAMPNVQKAAILKRTDRLLQAVKEAREEANSIEETETPKPSSALFSYLFPE